MARLTRKHPSSRWLFGEQLENRSLLATLTVTTTDDLVAEDGVVSLREAIISANTNTSVNADVVPAGSYGADTINLPAGTYTLTITGQNEDNAAEGDLDITQNLSIIGASAATTIIQAGPEEGSGIDRVFEIVETEIQPTVSMSHLTIRHGVVPASDVGGGILSEHNLTLTDCVVTRNRAGKGGGIYHSAEGTLTLMRSTVDFNFADKGGGILNSAGIVDIQDSTVALNTGLMQGGGILNTGTSMSLTNSTVSGNHGGDSGGGGIYNRAPLTITNTTISNNSANGSGAGISNTGGGTLSLLNVTIVYNIADAETESDGVGDGGGIYNPENATDARNTIIGHNTDSGGEAPDVSGTLHSLGYNLIQSTAGATITGDTTGNIIGEDPLLGPLSDNGGPTQTNAPMPGSPAIDAADPATFPPTDQRGVTRPQGLGGDIGAVEVEIGLPECNIETHNAPGAQGTAVVRSDADNLGSKVLVVTGTNKNDVIVIEPRPLNLTQVRVKNTGKVLAIISNSSFQHIVAYGLGGNDTIIVDGRLAQLAILMGGDGNDSLYGSRGDDQLDGGNGNDRLYGLGGNDAICGGAGDDFLNGGLGDDTLFGDLGNDHLYGDRGDDAVLGGTGNDFLYGSQGNDELYGQDGNDQLLGDAGNDIVIGGDGNDTLLGGSGRDLQIGGAGADQLYGDAGDDILISGSTTFDKSPLPLSAILAEWTSNNDYNARITNLRLGGGANGTFTLDNTTVIDDGTADLLYGGGDRDWFLIGSQDKVRDRAIIESIS